MLETALGVIFGGIVTILIIIGIERLRGPRVRLAVLPPAELPPYHQLQNRWRALRINVFNEQLSWWANWWMLRSPAQQCRGEIYFLRPDGTLFYETAMIGRWTAGSPEPRVFFAEGGVPMLTNPQELKTTVDIYPGSSEPLDVAIRVDPERDAYGWNNEAYYHRNWRNPERRLAEGRYVIRVVVSSSGRKCAEYFCLNNDGPLGTLSMDSPFK
jgi:hypothetical protein